MPALDVKATVETVGAVCACAGAGANRTAAVEQGCQEQQNCPRPAQWGLPRAGQGLLGWLVSLRT